jgi:hypothetical protein
VGRVPQGEAARGSQRWIQDLVNTYPTVLDATIGIGRIDWRSPLASDAFAEYQDAEFLECLGVTLPTRALGDFWPTGGPRWDALGRTEEGTVVLVKGKSSSDGTVVATFPSRCPKSHQDSSRTRRGGEGPVGDTRM